MRWLAIKMYRNFIFEQICSLNFSQFSKKKELIVIPWRQKNPKETAQRSCTILNSEKRRISKFHRCTPIVAQHLQFGLLINLAQMNESPFTTCRNCVWFESCKFFKLMILSPDFCDTKVLRLTLDIQLVVPFDFCKFPNEQTS